MPFWKQLLGPAKKVAIRCTEEFPEGKGHERHGLLAPISCSDMRNPSSLFSSSKGLHWIYRSACQDAYHFLLNDSMQGSYIAC